MSSFPGEVCSGSLADIRARSRDVCFTPKSRREASRLKESALCQKRTKPDHVSGAPLIYNLVGVLTGDLAAVFFAPPMVAKATSCAELLSAEVKSSEAGIEQINPIFVGMIAHPTH